MLDVLPCFVGILNPTHAAYRFAVVHNLRVINWVIIIHWESAPILRPITPQAPPDWPAQIVKAFLQALVEIKTITTGLEIEATPLLAITFCNISIYRLSA